MLVLLSGNRCHRVLSVLPCLYVVAVFVVHVDGFVVDTRRAALQQQRQELVNGSGGDDASFIPCRESSYRYVPITTTQCHHRTILSASNNRNDNNHKYDAPPSYSDNFLGRHHSQSQARKQLVTNALTTSSSSTSRPHRAAQTKDWQDSFSRNDLADFSESHMTGRNCLMVGDGMLGKDEEFDSLDTSANSNHFKLPWEEEAQSQVTSLRLLEAGLGDVTAEDSTNNHDDESSASTAALLRTEVVREPSRESSAMTTTTKDTKKNTLYDCIVDQGLMDAVLSLEDPAAVRELVYEAAHAMCELGIYVIVTRPLSAETKQALTECSCAGMEWQFDLDGISDERTTISVARRFNSDALPPVGKLSRFRP